MQRRYLFSSASSSLRQWVSRVVQGPGALTHFEDRILFGPFATHEEEDPNGIANANGIGEDGKGSSLTSSHASELDRHWEVFTDKSIGGSSVARFEILQGKDDDDDDRRHRQHHRRAVFHGTLFPPSRVTSGEEADACNEATQGKDKLRGDANNRSRGSFAFVRSVGGFLPRGALEDHDCLVLRVRSGDGHTYMLNLKTENWIVPFAASDDLWQVAFQPSADVDCIVTGGWREICLPFDGFTLSWKGKVVAYRSVMNHRNVASISIAIAKVFDADADAKGMQMQMPFRLELDWIKSARMGMQPNPSKAPATAAAADGR